MKRLLGFLFIAVLFYSCDPDDEPSTSTNKLRLKFTFDSTQTRLDNFGNVSTIPTGNSAQSPDFNLMGVHYIELAGADDIPAYDGEMLYTAPKTSSGGSEAYDFDQAIYGGNGEEFFTIDLADITPGTYDHIRISLSYQNYDISITALGITATGHVASFIATDQYVADYIIDDSTVTVFANKQQGYWALEIDYPGVNIIEGQAPEGSTTVPNPLFATSPIPLNSCLVTGTFSTPLEITGDETEDIVVNCSISTNKSFEWKDDNMNGIYEPLDGDTVVDMGVRGMIPYIE